MPDRLQAKYGAVCPAPGEGLNLGGGHPECLKDIRFAGVRVSNSCGSLSLRKFASGRKQRDTRCIEGMGEDAAVRSRKHPYRQCACKAEVEQV